MPEKNNTAKNGTRSSSRSGALVFLIFRSLVFLRALGVLCGKNEKLCRNVFAGYFAGDALQ
jgi:hypothetical protein